MKAVALQMALDILHKKEERDLITGEVIILDPRPLHNEHRIYESNLFSVRTEVQDERWAAQLEQSVQPAEGGEEGRDHRLLLRQPRPGQDTQAQV